MFLTELIKPIVDWRLQSSAKRLTGILEYLGAVHEDCASLLSWDGEPGDTYRVVQERLRAYYALGSTVLGDLLAGEDIECFMHATASARIYYWIRALEGRSGPEIVRLIGMRGGEYGSGGRSFSVVQRALAIYRGTAVTDEVPFDQAVKEIRDACLRDIALLDTMRLRISVSGLQATKR